MKYIKRITLTILILIIVGFLIRGWIYRNCITYKSIGNRTKYLASNKLIEYIKSKNNLNSKPNIYDITKLGLEITANSLNYSTSQDSNDPNNLINSKNAHCVGYASFFSTTCNYILSQYPHNNYWIAQPKKGQLYFLGINIHKYFHSPFFKDHDFVIIKNKVTGEILAVDPTINDYLGIDFVTFEE